MSKNYKAEVEEILASGVKGLNDKRVHNLFVELVEKMKVEGLNQLQVYEAFHSPYFEIAKSEQNGESEAEIEAFLCILDRIWGWGAPGQGLFPQSLNNESLAAFRKQRKLQQSEQ